MADILFSERRTRRLPTIRLSCGTPERAAEGSRGADAWIWRARGLRSRAGMVIGRGPSGRGAGEAGNGAATRLCSVAAGMFAVLLTSGSSARFLWLGGGGNREGSEGICPGDNVAMGKIACQLTAR